MFKNVKLHKDFRICLAQLSTLFFDLKMKDLFKKLKQIIKI